MNTPIQAPTQLKNGAQIIDMKPRSSDCWYVLAKTGGLHPFVVWTCWSDGQCEWGHYFLTINEAAEYFSQQ